ncbi:MAG: response regulator [Peptococcaceae bacterium]|jgi:signal transduction histidine kinase/CheY-like chemotaxis protein/HPt (histidine-containing phosphotransfer) domain-containing protein|nr:response regulator [Peptococcaceae bacterium]
MRSEERQGDQGGGCMVRQWQRLFALDGDMEEKIHEFLGMITTRLAAAKAGVVSFVPGLRAQVYSAKSGEGDAWNEQEQEEIISFARGILQGEADAEEGQARFGFKQPVWMAITFEGETYGALYADCGETAVWTPERENGLRELAAMLAVIFYNASVYRSRTEEIRARLTEVKAELDNANQAKNDFLSRMSHEIRTPINAIIGMARIAKTADQLDKVKQCVEKIDMSSRQLSVVINHILDMSKIKANTMLLCVEPFDFERMLINISNGIAIPASEKQQKLHIFMDMKAPRYYRGDEFRLSQVINNLLSNAVKFTPECGKIRLDIQEKSREENISTLEVSVSDTGVGIPAQSQTLLFTALEQVDGGIARKYGGTGMGLVICKNIVALMGGDITVQSREGEGSVFRFTVRLEIEESGKPRFDEKLNMSHLRVLLIDEDEETRGYVSRIMKEFGMETRIAATDEEGLSLLRDACQKKEPYDLMFVSWQRLDDGLAGVRRIKEEFDTPVVVVLSGWEWNEAENQVIAAGATAVIAKPLFASILLDTIQAIVGAPPKDEGLMISRRHSFAGYTILLAEDIEIHRIILERYLTDTGVQIDHAENGRVALEMFKKNPQKYDLILMDIHMPEMNGYEATRGIRDLDLPKAPEVPIIAMTANVFVEDIDKCLRNGMNDHLAKPIQVEQLFAKLRYYLTQYEEAPMPLKQEAVKPMREVVGDMEMAALENYIQVEEALARLKGNKTIYKTLLNAFLKSPYWEQLCTQIEAKNLEEAAKTAHAIKGMAANLSLGEIYSVITLLEAQLKSGFDYQESFEKLEGVMDQTVKYIKILTESL